MLLVYEKPKKAFVRLKIARGYEGTYYYLDVYTKDKSGLVTDKTTICRHHLVGIAGISQDCDYLLNEHILMRFTKIHNMWVDSEGCLRGQVNVMLLTNSEKILSDKKKRGVK